MSNISDFVDIKTAAKLLKISEKNVYALFERGRFPNSKKIGGGVAISKADIETHKLNHRKPGRPSTSEKKE